MSFKYDYIPLDQLESDKPSVILLAPGEAKFNITTIYDTDKDGGPRTTRDGLPKITLVLTVTDRKGAVGLIYHDISSKMAWAIVSLGKALGRSLYNSSGYTNWKSIIGLSGSCELENRDPTPPYDIKTTIKRYIPLPDSYVAPPSTPQPAILSQEDLDDLPF